MPNEPQPSVLYVDDDLRSREVMQVILGRVMRLPQTAFFENSENFMERLKALPFRPDIILLDILMHPLNGYELLKLLRADPEYHQTCIAAITSSVMASDVHQLQDAGFDGLIGKPVMHKVFPELMKKLLAGEKIWYIP